MSTQAKRLSFLPSAKAMYMKSATVKLISEIFTGHFVGKLYRVELLQPTHHVII